jgi:hypothetical protein
VEGKRGDFSRSQNDSRGRVADDDQFEYQMPCAAREWSESDERHGRLSREVAVERGGSNRDTIEPWELARWEAVTQTGKPTGRNAGAHESKLPELRRHAI